MAVPISVLITKDNVFTQAYANVYNLINNRNNIPDPADAAGNRKFVYTREPNFLADNFAGFPLIIVQDESHSQGKKVADNTKAFFTDETTIIVMMQDGIFKTGDGFSILNSISDSILKTLNDKVNSQNLRDNGLRNKEFSSVDFDWGEVDGKPVFRREFNLRFSNQLRVIA